MGNLSHRYMGILKVGATPPLLGPRTRPVLRTVPATRTSSTTASFPSSDNLPFVMVTNGVHTALCLQRPFPLSLPQLQFGMRRGQVTPPFPRKFFHSEPINRSVQSIHSLIPNSPTSRYFFTMGLTSSLYNTRSTDLILLCLLCGITASF